jgi:general secretion pathway protein I
MKRQAGFTLIEVVVAFVLLSLVLAVSFEVFSTGMRRAGDLDDRAQALVVAQSRLATIGMEEPLADAVSSGETEDRRFQWTLTVRRSDETTAGADGKVPMSTYALYRVEVHVAWRGADTRDHALDLATLAAGPKPQ